jgi:hypothetical protein
MTGAAGDPVHKLVDLREIFRRERCSEFLVLLLKLVVHVLNVRPVRSAQACAQDLARTVERLNSNRPPFISGARAFGCRPESGLRTVAIPLGVGVVAPPLLAGLLDGLLGLSADVPD